MFLDVDHDIAVSIKMYFKNDASGEMKKRFQKLATIRLISKKRHLKKQKSSKNSHFVRFSVSMSTGKKFHN